MKFKLLADWDCGAWRIPSGTIIEAEPDALIPVGPTQLHPMDLEARAALAHWFELHLFPRGQSAPSPEGN